MKIVKPRASTQCAATVSPGEYVIDRWDGTRCTENRHVLFCHECNACYCILTHWSKHLEEKHSEAKD